MKFAALIDYSRDTSKIAGLRSEHHQYMFGLLESGRIFAAGPLAANLGALIVYEAETLAQVEECIQNDPFHAAGVIVKWQIHPLAYWSAKACKGA